MEIKIFAHWEWLSGLASTCEPEGPALIPSHTAGSIPSVRCAEGSLSMIYYHY